MSFIESNITLYIHDIDFLQISDIKLAYIDGEEYIHAEIEDSAPAFIHGVNSTDDTLCIPAFVYGQPEVFYRSYGSTDAYIHSQTAITPPDQLLPKTALEFDRAKSQYAQIVHNSVYENLTAFTLNTWIMIKQAPDGVNYRLFVEKDHANVRSIGLHYSPAGKIHGGVNTGSWSAVNSSTTILQNRWYMVTMRYDGSMYRQYINGIEDGSFAKTGTVVMDTNPWRIAYWNDTPSYTSMAIADLKLWNYALTPAEISSMYKTPNICVSKFAYINIKELEDGIASNKKAYINSELSNTNPFTVRTSVGVMIAPNGSLGSKLCFIASGNYQESYFDMIADAQNRSDTTFDCIIFVRGGITSFNEMIVGHIEYPITRNSTIPLVIYTKDVPGIDQGYIDCHVQTSNNLSNNISLYIQAGTPSYSSIGAYIAGPFQNISKNLNCFIQTELRSNIELYIDGSEQDATSATISCHISGPEPENATSTIDCYIVTAGIDSYNDCYIHVASPITSSNYMYISGPETTEINHTLYMHLFGAGQLMYTKFAFVDGVFVADNLVMNCSIVTNNVEIDNLPAMVMSHTSRGSFKYLNISGNKPIVNSIPAFLHSNLWVSNQQQSFIHGRVKRESSRRAYIVGSESSSDNNALFIHGSSGETSTLNAFIQSRAILQSQACYITAIAGSESIKRMYIANLGTLNATKLDLFIIGHITSSQTKMVYISNVGSSMNHRRGYIEGA